MQSPTMLHWHDCGSYSPQNCSRPSWMVWKKRLPGDKVAVLISNLAEEPQDVRVMWWQVGSACRAGVSCTLRDVFAHNDLAADASGGFVARALPPHDSRMLVVGAPS